MRLRREIARGRVVALAVVAALAAFAMLLPVGASAAPQFKWLCKPGLKGNPCASSLKTTVRGPKGPDRIVDSKAAKSPKVDCFYVYPTVSSQQTENATLAKDPEILAIAQQQASRFSQACRVYAPVYRQVTIKGIGEPTLPRSALEIAYGDVRAAWRTYLAKYNHGRGVVLIGHSQGGGLLTELVKREIDPHPARRELLVSALLLGANVAVPIGKDVGGSFRHLPACRSKNQIRCIVAYSMFDMTPPDDALFGRAGGAFGAFDPKKFEVLCTDPTRLTGDHGALQPYVRTDPFPGTLGYVTPPPPEATTPWVTYPKLYSGHCAHKDGADWLQVSDIAGLSDDRPRFKATLGPTWGFHLGDVNLALGNLVKLVRLQAKEYRFERVSE